MTGRVRTLSLPFLLLSALTPPAQAGGSNEDTPTVADLNQVGAGFEAIESNLVNENNGIYRGPIPVLSCVDPAYSGTSPICTSSTSCVQSLIPFSDQQLNLGYWASSAAAPNYPCTLGGSNICDELLPDQVSQTVTFDPGALSGISGNWSLNFSSNGNSFASPAFTAATGPADIDSAVEGLNGKGGWVNKSPGPELENFSATGAFPSYTLTYETQDSLAQSSGFSLSDSLWGTRVLYVLGRPTVLKSSVYGSLSAPSTPKPVPGDSVLCGPTAGSMVIQGMLNYFPCEVTSSAQADLLSSFNIPNPIWLATHPGNVPTILAIQAEVNRDGTNMLFGGGSYGGVEGRVGDFNNAITGWWGPGSATNYSSVTTEATTFVYNSMHAGNLQSEWNGWYAESDSFFGLGTDVTFVRNGGHCQVPIGYTATPGSSYTLASPASSSMVPQSQILGTPYGLTLHDPEYPVAPVPYNLGQMVNGVVCRTFGSGIKFRACTSIQVPAGSATQDFLGDWVGNNNTGHGFSFIDGYDFIGIPAPLPKITPIPLPVHVLGPDSLLANPNPNPPDPGPENVANLAALETAVDAGGRGLTLTGEDRQAVTALQGGGASAWSQRFTRLYYAPKVVAGGGTVDVGSLTSGYRALAGTDTSGFIAGLNGAYQQLNQETAPPSGSTLRWAWLHPRHSLRSLLLEYAADLGQSIPAIQSAVLSLAESEAMQTPNVPVISANSIASDEQRDIAYSLAGALTVPVTAHRILIANMNETQALQLTASVLQHQPHFVVRNAIRTNFLQQFPNSAQDLLNAVGTN